VRFSRQVKDGGGVQSRRELEFMMPITSHFRMFAWTLLGASACYVGLWGLAISSASVVKSHDDFMEFGFLAAAKALSIAFSARGALRAVGPTLGLFYVWCLTTGWKIEQSNFDAAVGAPLRGLNFGTFIGLLAALLITAFLKLTSPSRLGDEIPRWSRSSE
jgi:hypothetical protein